MVIVDTSAWVQFLRAKGSPEHQEVDRCLQKQEVVMVGPVLAELLQGARTFQELEQLHRWLTALPYLADTQQTWARVGALSYQLRQQGEAQALVDLLIAALAQEHGHQVYTLDEHFQRIPGVALHQAEEP